MGKGLQIRSPQNKTKEINSVPKAPEGVYDGPLTTSPTQRVVDRNAQKLTPVPTRLPIIP